MAQGHDEERIVVKLADLGKTCVGWRAKIFQMVSPVGLGGCFIIGRIELRRWIEVSPTEGPAWGMMVTKIT